MDYRMIIAVATTESVILYDTQQWCAFAILSNLHLASISDVAWYEAVNFHSYILSFHFEYNS